ncbi:hypothetical protein CDD83_10150 [Cordyceps sp. RAO-2017]|nr:hypothetical protein CDD83_10150 [Cordyceps sp. RAO-2017]
MSFNANQQGDSWLYFGNMDRLDYILRLSSALVEQQKEQLRQHYYSQLLQQQPYFPQQPQRPYSYPQHGLQQQPPQLCPCGLQQHPPQQNQPQQNQPQQYQSRQYQPRQNQPQQNQPREDQTREDQTREDQTREDQPQQNEANDTANPEVHQLYTCTSPDGRIVYFCSAEPQRPQQQWQTEPHALEGDALSGGASPSGLLGRMPRATGNQTPSAWPAHAAHRFLRRFPPPNSSSSWPSPRPTTD